MTEKTMNRLALAGLAIIALVMYGLVAHQEYVDARAGYSVCEERVRSCE